MTYEDFVKDLDAGDSFTATMLDILVKVRCVSWHYTSLPSTYVTLVLVLAILHSNNTYCLHFEK